MPTGTVEALAKSSSVLAVDLNESIPLPKPRGGDLRHHDRDDAAGPGQGTA